MHTYSAYSEYSEYTYLLFKCEHEGNDIIPSTTLQYPYRRFKDRESPPLTVCIHPEIEFWADCCQ